MIVASLWHIRWYEALLVSFSPAVGLLAVELFSARARANRARLRARRRSERQLVYRMRTW